MDLTIDQCCSSLVLGKSLSEFPLVQETPTSKHFLVEKLKFATISRAKCEEVKMSQNEIQQSGNGPLFAVLARSQQVFGLVLKANCYA